MYNKLFTKILDSSMWLEPTPTRIVWVTMLAAMDEDGFCSFASPANVAHRAVVSLAEAEAALASLEAPDPNSSDPENDGRRLERIPGGWYVLNAKKYRETVTRIESKRLNRERQRRHYANKKARPNVSPTPPNADLTQSEANTEADAEDQKPDQEQAQSSRRFNVPVENFPLMQKLADGICHDSSIPVGERKDALKDACAKASLLYTSEQIIKALNAVEVRRKMGGYVQANA